MSDKAVTDKDIVVFKKTVGRYKQLIDDDIAAYSKELQQATLKQFGASARLITDGYLEILARGGKRIRGSLVMLGYEMCGGRDRRMILEAARAVEMIHAYLLIMDDIQDRSLTRRGGPTVPVMLAGHHRRHHLAGDPAHFGIAMSLNAMGIGNHAAQDVLSRLAAPDDRKLKVLSILNTSIMTTAHGQTNDIMNEVIAHVDEADIDRVLEWKTAHYTFINPLHIGMVLAGEQDENLGAITEYALHAGKAFQITDDILGTFGSEFESGKSPMDDTKEGKRTLLSAYALEHTTSGNKNFLLQMLGNTEITPAEFERCKDIFIESGALEYAQGRASEHVVQALGSIKDVPDGWNLEGIQFLRGLARYLLTRSS